MLEGCSIAITARRKLVSLLYCQTSYIVVSYNCFKRCVQPDYHLIKGEIMYVVLSSVHQIYIVSEGYLFVICISLLTLILRRSRTGTVWFYTSTSNKRAARPKLYTKSLTRDLKRMYTYSSLTLVRISFNL